MMIVDDCDTTLEPVMIHKQTDGAAVGGYVVSK